MRSDSAEPTSEETPLWEFVRPQEYQQPSLQARSAATNAWTRFKRLIYTPPEPETTPVKQENELRSLAEVRLAHLVAPLPTEDMAEALGQALGDWLNADTQIADSRLVIAQPFSFQSDGLIELARQKDLAVIPAPTAEQILNSDDDWFNHWPEPGHAWVLPQLEHCYLRHAHGLNLLRRLFQRIEHNQLGKGLIGCDSWALSYLRHVLPFPPHQALTLQAFDAERMLRLFSQMVQPKPGVQVRFFNTATGRDIISVPVEQQQPHDELIQLAAYCRGNVGTALHYWRERLRSEPIEDEGTTATKDEPSPLHEEHVWVAQMLPEPTLPAGKREEQVLFMHALLLHGGIEESLLSETLPLSPNRCSAVLSQLRQAGLVSLTPSGRWHLQPGVYAWVKRLLDSLEYLTDEF